MTTEGELPVARRPATHRPNLSIVRPNGEAPNLGGRPRIELDLKTLEKFCMMFPTVKQIAAFFEVSEDYVWRRLREEPDFREAVDRGKEKGKLKLRQAQLRVAMEDGNPTMLIWLGKQYLDQSDKQEVATTIDIHAERAEDVAHRKQVEAFADAALQKAKLYGISLEVQGAAPAQSIELERSDGEEEWTVQ